MLTIFSVGMVSTVNVKWIEKGTFLASTAQGQSFVIDFPKSDSDVPRGMSPGRVLLSAIGGCSLATFFYIIEKMRKDLTQNITSISVEVTGETTPPPDDYYNHIHIKYLIEGKSINRETLERALGMVEKYCTVSLTVSGKAKVDWSYDLTKT
jgi:putative redox protein